MKNQIISKNATVVETAKKIAIVEAKINGENKTFVAKTKSKKEIGDNVELFVAPRFPKVLRLMLYCFPLILFLIGFGVGFIFSEELYHYILASSLGILGFAILAIILLIDKNNSKNAYYIK